MSAQLGTHVLDADVFIEAKRLYYDFDVFPGFWDWLAYRRETGDVLSVEAVGDELCRGTDRLADWAREMGSEFFVPPDERTIAAFAEVAAWAESQSYERAAIDEFFRSGDYYLVAHAKAHAQIIVTHEVVKNTPKKIKIPNVCKGLGVRYMSIFQLLRETGARFDLRKEPPPARTDRRSEPPPSDMPF